MNKGKMAETTRQYIINILISAFGLLLWGTALFFLLGLNNKRNEVPSSTGDIQTISKPIRDASLSTIQNVDNILSGGLSWTDYITKFETNQPNISSSSSSKNTEEMHNYLYKNRLLFDIPAGKNGLLLIVTKKPVAEDRNLFLAIWWSTKWELRKEKSIPTNSENKYLFDINNLPIARFTPGISLFDNTIDWKIQIGVLVGEKDNSVESVTMIFY